MKMYGLRLILVVLVGFVVLTSYGWVCCSSVTVSHPSASFNHPQQTCTHSIGNQKLKPITKHTYLAASLSNGATVCSHNDATFLASNFIGRSSNADLVRRIRTSLGQICSSYIPPLLIGSSAAIAVKKSRQIINLLVSEWLPRYPVQMPVLAGLVLSAMTFFVENDLSKSTLPFSTLLTKQVVKRSLLRWLAMIITIGGGCSLGVAAPAVEIGMFMAFLATINVTSYVPFINSGSEEHFILILAGAAAGFAANFNAPLSGILFASEVTSRLLPKPKDQQSTPLNIMQPKVLSKVVCAVIAAGI